MKRPSTALSVTLSIAALVSGVWLHLRASAPQAPSTAVHGAAAPARDRGQPVSQPVAGLPGACPRQGQSSSPAARQ